MILFPDWAWAMETPCFLKDSFVVEFKWSSDCNTKFNNLFIVIIIKSNDKQMCILSNLPTAN